MDELAARRAAETLLAAHKANVQFRTLGPPDRPADVADAYDIQQRFVTLLRGQHGDAVGYKVGLTSAAMQTFCGIDHPIAGVVLASTPVPGGAVVIGAPVALVVASGASTVPGVSGMTPTQARSALESAGFVVAPLDGSGEDVRIVSTEPAAGRRVLVGETVVLIAGSTEPTPAPTEPAPPASPEPTPSRAPVPTTDPNG